jgi:uncharacterized protein YerC
MEQAKVDRIVLLLAQGYAQKTVARCEGVNVATVGRIGKSYKVGRRPGMDRKRAKQAVSLPLLVLHTING